MSSFFHLMLSSPKMFVMLLVGTFCLVAFVGAIIVVVVQTLRGRLFVDYMGMAAQAQAAYVEEKKARKKRNANRDDSAE